MGKADLMPPARSCDWPEDYDQENGCYQNECCVCGQLFHGHKRRPICRDCKAAAEENRTDG